MQGLAGGGMTPVAQSILAAAFPPAKRNQGFALYGLAVVVAPVRGPDAGRMAERQSLLALVLWELSRARPLIDLHKLTSRQFGTCFLVMLGTGALLIATTQALPQLLQDQYGYTATWAGLAISPDGAVTMGMMLIVGRLGDVQPRYLIAAGSIIAGFAMIDLLRMTPDADFWFFAWSRIYLGVGLPLIFIPITTASYEGLPRH